MGETAWATCTRLIAAELGETRFVGYSDEATHGEVIALVVNGARANRAGRGDRVEVITAVTPFYGESGGQVGDTGVVTGPRGKLEVTDTQRPVPGLVVHLGVLGEGELQVGDRVELAIDRARRDLIRANHSATHLLHLALREALGEHVKQAGSVVGPDSFRFDFAHFQPLSGEELHRVEGRVNELVRQNADGRTDELAIDDARKTGAMMIFGEKYGEIVRKSCGRHPRAPHRDRLLQRSPARSRSPPGCAASWRAHRSARAALAQRIEDELRHAAGLLKAGPFDVAAKVEAAQRRLKELERALEEAASWAAAQSGRPGGAGGGGGERAAADHAGPGRRQGAAPARRQAARQARQRRGGAGRRGGWKAVPPWPSPRT